jgi:hypothetical protein
MALLLHHHTVCTTCRSTCLQMLGAGLLLGHTYNGVLEFRGWEYSRTTTPRRACIVLTSDLDGIAPSPSQSVHDMWGHLPANCAGQVYFQSILTTGCLSLGVKHILALLHQGRHALL